MRWLRRRPPTFWVVATAGLLVGGLLAYGTVYAPKGGASQLIGPVQPELCILHTCTPTPPAPTETATPEPPVATETPTPAATTVQVQAPSCQSKCMKTDVDLTCQINAGTTCVLLEMQEGWSAPRPLTVTFTTAFSYTAQLVR